MSEETTKTRDLNNYLHKTCLIRDGFSGNEDEYVAVPMGLNLNNGAGSLIVEVWRSEKGFNNFDYSEKSPGMTKTLPITQEIIKNYADLFNLVESESLKFLEVDSNNFSLEKINIDLNLLSVDFLARHKEKINRFSQDTTANLEEFEFLKEKYSKIVESFYAFAFEYMATNQQLSKFK
ncbi:MAG: hypothetical protein K1X72_04235 [Pyrinomonadaceae bacterium]|nr:hypothetical protein [Pyrinomonadaceae bacterium]